MFSYTQKTSEIPPHESNEVYSELLCEETAFSSEISAKPLFVLQQLPTSALESAV